MQLKTPIRAFQTGRTYTKEGQRIAWAVTCVFDDGWSEVSFYDLDRFIEGRSVLPKAPEAVTDADVLFLYDHNAYRGYIENPDLKLALRDAALAAPVLRRRPAVCFIG